MKPLLVVDGYNVIGAWTEAEKQRLASGRVPGQRCSISCRI